MSKKTASALRPSKVCQLAVVATRSQEAKLRSLKDEVHEERPCGSTMAVLWQIYPWQSAVFLPNVFDRSHNCVGTVCRLFPDLDAQDQPDERTG